MIEFNINNYVYVQLTPLGKEHLEKQHNSLYKDFPLKDAKFKLPEEDSEKWSRWQLHNLITTFGDCFIGSFSVPFKTVIRFEEDK